MHHAHLLVGSREWAHAQIPQDEILSSPDVSIRSYERMVIADARSLIRDAYLRPVTRTHRTFILDAASILPDAQNALLKLLEEPPADALFFFVVPREEILLPTLRSRFNLLATEHAAINTTDFDAFLSLPYAQRLTRIVEKLEAEDLEWVRSVVHGAALYAEASRDPVFIRDMLKTEAFIMSPGASKKMLLEHVALSLKEK